MPVPQDQEKVTDIITDILQKDGETQPSDLLAALKDAVTQAGLAPSDIHKEITKVADTLTQKGYAPDSGKIPDWSGRHPARYAGQDPDAGESGAAGTAAG
jgi:hypothetical protein